MLDNSLNIIENELKLLYYRLICFYRDKNNNIIFIFDKLEKIYTHSNIQMHKMIDNFYILEDLSKINFNYIDDTKILIIEIINYKDLKFNLINNLENENEIVRFIKRKKNF